jgi:hypothetical protein
VTGKRLSVVVDGSAPVWAQRLAVELNGILATLGADADVAGSGFDVALTQGLALKADTTALTAGLATKSDVSHTHVAANITDFAAAVAAASAPSFVSPNQTITAGGPLTIAHGLSGTPRTVKCEAECIAADIGFSIGAVIEISPHSDPSNNAGLAIEKNATNIFIRFGSRATGSMAYPNRSSGGSATLNNASWVFRVRATL